MSIYHKSVFLTEALELLQIKKNKKYIDATLGGGGHTFEILRKNGIVLGIDLDTEAIEHVKVKWKKIVKEEKLSEENLILKKGNFRKLEEIARLNEFEKVAGIIYDLGVSSNQIDRGERGFSYLKQGPLDMRMDENAQVKASDLVNVLKKGELYEIFSRFGQEHRAWVISDSIVRTRRIRAIQTTDDLIDVIREAYKIKSKDISPFLKAKIAKKVFQALRIAVNSEFENLKETLPQAVNLLDRKGRLIVISFHSIEDRIVKHKFLEFEKQGLGKIITKKPLIPTVEEMRENSRSKSAKLRVFEKI
ncbi:MAG TPA: 16S rRNA (cytosine(1402)-N(4))-methyltransferase RsmH [Patescibacteria group bacterium]|nr:16S rRNA (cytosine(1402)-N(4))-methyltransferase RsmH [Patescibacteria group bacterium]